MCFHLEAFQAVPPPPTPDDDDPWPLDFGWAAKRRPTGLDEKLGKIRKTYNLASLCALT